MNLNLDPRVFAYIFLFIMICLIIAAVRMYYIQTEYKIWMSNKKVGIRYYFTDVPKVFEIYLLNDSDVRINCDNLGKYFEVGFSIE